MEENQETMETVVGTSKACLSTDMSQVRLGFNKKVNVLNKADILSIIHIP